MMRSWIFWISIGAIVGVVGMFAYGLTIDPKLVKSPLLGQPAPDWNVTRLQGDVALGLRELRGKPLVLNFWASWCVACREEAVILQQAHLEFEKAQGRIRVVGIAIQDTPEKAMAFARKFGKTYFLGLDNAEGEISLNYGLYGVPETFFIDAKGIVRIKKVGAVTREDIENFMNQVVGEETPDA